MQKQLPSLLLIQLWFSIEMESQSRTYFCGNGCIGICAHAKEQEVWIAAAALKQPRQMVLLRTRISTTVLLFGKVEGLGHCVD
jgi:hypothetical protein